MVSWLLMLKAGWFSTAGDKPAINNLSGWPMTLAAAINKTIRRAVWVQ